MYTLLVLSVSLFLKANLPKTQADTERGSVTSFDAMALISDGCIHGDRARGDQPDQSF